VHAADGVYTVTAEFSVSEPATIAIAALTDYENIPRFMPAVRDSTVLERTAAHTVIEEALARFMMFSRRIHLVLEVREHAGTIRFRDRCGQSFGQYEGAWTISERGGRTSITYQLSARPAIDVPGFLLKRLLKRDAAVMIEQLQTEIAARAGR
jgi:carbon monoxide dehydrogenase subunit G